MFMIYIYLKFPIYLNKYRVPKDPKLKEKWMEIIRANVSEEYQGISQVKLKLCSLHFNIDNMKNNGRLDPGSIPTIFPAVNRNRPHEQKPKQVIRLIRVKPGLETPRNQRSTVQP